MADSDDKSPSKLAAIEKRAKRMEAKLRRDYKIGLRALKVKKPLRKTFAGRNGLSEDTLRKLRAFAENYTEDELDELCALRRKGSGLPLHFGYVIYLLAAQSAARRACVAAMEAKKPDGKGKVDHEKARRAGKRARAKFAKWVKSKGWTAPELYAAVVAEYGLKKGHHGRTKLLPQDPRGASQLAIGEITKWCSRLQELLRSQDDERFPAPTRSDLCSQLDVVSRKIHKIKRLLK